MNDAERKSWNENARKVQDFHRRQDRPFPGWRNEKSLARNLAVLAFATIPLLILVDWTSDK